MFKNKQLEKQYKRQWYLENKERLNAMGAENYLKNKDKYLAQGKDRYIKNRNKILAQCKIYAKKNSKKIASYQKEWRINNHDKKVSQDKVYYQKNRKKILTQTKEYKKRLYGKDMNFTLRIILRSRLNAVLKGKTKRGSSVSDLGCSIPELKTHLEKQFLPGMTWNNHGKWHLDHIKLLASFNLEDRNQFLQACHYTNLQPLWASNNLGKNKIPSYA